MATLADPPTTLSSDPDRWLLPGLSVVLPCHNEVDNIAEAIHDTRAAAGAITTEHEVIVVDDGSTDGSGDVVRQVALATPGVRLVTHAFNRGYGAALRSGIAAARMPWVLVMDSDLQFDLGELPRLARQAGEHDFVIGRRVTRSDPAHRRLNAAAWNALVRLVLRLPVHDVDCAFKLFRTQIAQSLDLRCEGATISPELVVKSMAAGARVTEIGVSHRPRIAGRASGARPRVVLRALRELVLLRRDLPPRGLGSAQARL